MHELEFSTNWNGKLFLDNFGTVRLHNPSKYFVGNQMEVFLNRVDFGAVTVVAVRTFKYGEIRDALSYLDTGKPAHYLGSLIKKFYEKKVDLNRETLLDHAILHYTKRNYPNQALAIKDWWEAKVQASIPNQQMAFNL